MSHAISTTGARIRFPRPRSSPCWKRATSWFARRYGCSRRSIRASLLVNATKITGFDGRALDVTDPVDHTEAEQFSIYQARAFFQFLKDNIPGCENAYFIDYGAEVGVRQTRSIEGMERLMNADVVGTRKRPGLHRPLKLADRASLRRQTEDGVADRRLLRGALRHPRAEGRAQHHRRRPLPQRRTRGAGELPRNRAVFRVRPRGRARDRHVDQGRRCPFRRSTASPSPSE